MRPSTSLRRAFVGLGLEDAVPDAKTLWLYREALAKAGAGLFTLFDTHLKAKGLAGDERADYRRNNCSSTPAAWARAMTMPRSNRVNAGGVGEQARQEPAERQGCTLDQKTWPVALWLQEPHCHRSAAQAGAALSGEQRLGA